MGHLIPKDDCLPFLLCFVSGLRSPLAFLVELGAAISVASTTVPCLNSPLQKHHTHPTVARAQRRAPTLLAISPRTSGTDRLGRRREVHQRVGRRQCLYMAF